LHSETPNSIASDEDDTNENGSLISYKWRQLDSTSDSQQNQPGVNCFIVFTTEIFDKIS